MARPTKVIAGFVILAFIALAACLWLVLRQPAMPSALPHPNGYDEFVRAGKLIADDQDFSTLNGERLRNAILSNAVPLRALRTGLTHPCRVPPGRSVDDPRLKDLAVLKRAAQLLSAEGRWAEAEGRFGDAGNSYLTAMRMGQEVQHGGIMIDALVGIAIESLGAAPAEKLVKNLNAEQCRQFAVALEAAEPGRESTQAVLQTEKAWARRALGWRYPMYAVAALVNYKATRLTQQRYVGRAITAQLRTQQLMTALAARAYELEKGARPLTWADVVPAYLKSVPRDPNTGSNMLFYP